MAPLHQTEMRHGIPPFIASFADACRKAGIDLSFFTRYTVLPGFVDVHVHLREPGFSYKETIATGTAAAARGGYTALCAMPNLNPLPDTPEHLQQQLSLIDRDARVRVYPYATITKGQQGEVLADMQGTAPYVAGYSDDGRGVQCESLMRAAMQEARRLDRPIVAHCEDETLLHGGYIHDGAYARRLGHRGISSESEWRQLERDLRLVRESGCRYHACHLSTKESVALIRDAKAAGLDVSCETAPHYLLLHDEQLQEDGRFKMNPPIRTEEDRQALLEGLADGTIDMIATDHAPHSAEEKAGGLSGSLMGIVGLETAFPLLYTYLVKTGVISLSRLVELLASAPRKRFGIPAQNDFTVFDLTQAYTIDPADFLSKGKNTPFTGWQVYGRCLLTLCGGKVAYRDQRGQ
ncbi:MAG: dihydroorotase [Eubacteriales bacterium]